MPAGAARSCSAAARADFSLEAGLEPGVQFGEVARQAALCVLGGGILDRQNDHGCAQKLLHLGHRGDEAGTLIVVEWLEETPCHRIGPAVDLGIFGEADLGQTGAADASIVRTCRDGHQPLPFQRAQHAAGIARVHPQPGTQRAHLQARRPDFPQRPGFSQRTLTAEELVRQDANALGGSAVESAGQCNGGFVHISDFSQKYVVRQTLTPPPVITPCHCEERRDEARNKVSPSPCGGWAEGSKDALCSTPPPSHKGRGCPFPLRPPCHSRRVGRGRWSTRNDRGSLRPLVASPLAMSGAIRRSSRPDRSCWARSGRVGAAWRRMDGGGGR